ncbi:hypothetical protein [Nonomuraea basaltis]|uniref:hypothetical protein n=1 Tax=Nonomuraea basaltis TaxID=2495887 RepID=UPI00110C63D5|nr:hypothetical protein [Nonomuraea basaltis]TMR96104.1 hypothetical protein EJK15_25165 [Nonomuraea basaltis]
MKRTALLLSVAMLGGLLAASPASAAPVAVKAAVAKVKASPAKQSGACPTTVGFSAVVSAKGKGTVRYRWVRGDGSKGVIKSFRVNGARKVVVKDRQTFDRTISGWQAVEILGKKGLSGKAPFRVTCSGPATVWDFSHPMPDAPGKPLVAAASVKASPATYTGACPTTVTFTATIQVSRTPAKVDYWWIDGAAGEGPRQSLYFAAGGPRSSQVTLPLSVGSSTSGWKAVEILTANGHDSGRAAYQVTCKPTQPPTSPSPTPSGTPSTSPTPSGTPTTSPTPSGTPTGEPPAQKPEPLIVGLTPGDYEGYCDGPIAYQATGRITLPAGPGQRVVYWWLLDNTQWQQEYLYFPAATQPRSQAVNATWAEETQGTHTLGLMTLNGPAQPVERTYTYKCLTGPEPTAKLTIPHILTPVYQGQCENGIGLRVDSLILTDRDTEVRYRVVVDGKPGPIRTKQVKAGRHQTIGDLWYSNARSSTTGVARIEVLNQNKPAKEAPYSVKCLPQTPSPDGVRITEFWPVAYYGDCVEAPYPTVHGSFRAPPGTEITYRWVIDGKPDGPFTHKVGQSGYAQVQAFHWTRHTKTSGVVALEVLSHNKPAIEAVYPVHCQN